MMSKLFDLGATNSAIGEAWVARWCRNCYRGEYKCRIVNLAMGMGPQPELQYDENDEPICIRFKHKREHIVKHRPPKDQEEIEF